MNQMVGKSSPSEADVLATIKRKVDKMTRERRNRTALTRTYKCNGGRTMWERSPSETDTLAPSNAPYPVCTMWNIDKLVECSLTALSAHST
jgi:hypothetical protein